MVSSATQSSIVAKEKKGEAFQVLYSFWESLPEAAFIEISEKISHSHPVRPAIMKILREGIIEYFDRKKTEGIRRYALNSKEIMDILNTEDKEVREKYRLNDMQLMEVIPISRTNLYFHLDKLEEFGFIKEVAKILEGRHKITYYGRTSRLFFLEDPNKKLNYYKDLLNEFSAFSKILGQRIDQEHVSQAVQEYAETRRRYKQVIAKWIGKNSKQIYENNLDVNKIMKAILLISSTNPSIAVPLKKLNMLFQEILSEVAEDIF
ncbi:MAG: hypothetical protein ACFFB3_04800 [Candidatus Hodarchaeota archaeon]